MEFNESKPAYRPFKNSDELIKEWTIRRYGQEKYLGEHSMELPPIWVKRKENKWYKHQIIFYSSTIVIIASYINGEPTLQEVYLNNLFDKYTFLDGSPCGIEE